MEATQRGAAQKRVCLEPPGREELPDRDWVRGMCPCCAGVVVSNCYRIGSNYVIVWECEGSLVEPPTCQYRRVL